MCFECFPGAVPRLTASGARRSFGRLYRWSHDTLVVQLVRRSLATGGKAAVEVWSQSQREWLAAVVTAVDDGGGDLVVEYEDDGDGKVVPRPDIHATVRKAPAVGSGSSSESEDLDQGVTIVGTPESR